MDEASPPTNGGDNADQAKLVLPINDVVESRSRSRLAGSWRRKGAATSQGSVKTVSYFKLFRLADKWDYLLMLLGSVGAVAAGTTLPGFTLIFGDVIDKIGSNVDPSALGDAIEPLLLWFVWLGIIALVGSYAEMAFWQWTASRQTVRLRERYLRCALSNDIGFYDTSATTGGLLQGLNEEVGTVQLAIGDKVGGLIHNITLFVSGFAIAFFAGWDMTLVLLAMLPVLALFGGLASVLSGRVARSAQHTYGTANGIATQALLNVRTVYAFNAEERTVQAYSDELINPMKAGTMQSLIKGLTIGGTQMVAMFSYGAAMWYGQSRIVAGAYDGGQVITTMFAAIIGAFSLGQAAPNIQYLINGRIAGAKMFEVLDRQPPIRLDEPGGQRTSSVQGHIQLRDVHFAYPSRPDTPVFRGFNLEVQPGRTVALVGPSGSGKSTVIGLLQRFYDPQQGQMLLDGLDIRSLDLQWYRSQLGLVEQLPTLFATTIARNIEFGRPGASREEVQQAAVAANVHEFIVKLPKGYDTLCGERGFAFSGGQKQRIAIARAILRNPKVLLLDEATSALDSRSERLVQTALNRLMVGRTTVVVAHRLSTVMSADSIAVVEKGRLVEMGPPADLLANPTGAFATLVKLQRRGGDAAIVAEPGEGAEGGDAALVEGEEEEEVVGIELEAVGAANVNEGTTRKRSSAEGPYPHPRMAALEVPYAAAATPVATLVAASTAAVDIEAARESLSMDSAPLGGSSSSMQGQRKWWQLRRRKVAPVSAGGSGDKGKEGGKPGKEQQQEEVEPKANVGFVQLAKLNKPEWWLLLLGVPASVVVGCINPSFAITLSELMSVFYLDLDQITSEARMWSLIFVGIGIAAFIAAVVQQVTFGAAGQKLGRRMRVLMLRSVLKQDIAYFDREENSSGAIASRLSTDAVAVRGAVADQLGVMAQFTACLTFALIVSFIAGWRMTLVLLACLPILVASTIVQVNFQMNLGKKSSGSFERATAQVSEAFSSIRTVTAFGMQDQVCATYSKALEAPRRAAALAAQVSGIGFGLSPFILFCTYSLGFWYGAKQIEERTMDFEQVMTVFLAIFISAFGLAEVQVSFPDVGKAKAAVQRVFSVVQRQPPIADDPDAEVLPEVKGAIELRDVYFCYPTRREVPVFRGFNLEVQPGRTVALVGPSGGGKSTVIGLLQRFYDPQQGQVLLDGHDTRTLRLSWMRSQFGLVSQDPALFSATVRDNITYGRTGASPGQVEDAARAANAHDFIMGLPDGYDTPVGDLGVQLSGGQKQRIAIARAVLRDPPVLLLDEATSALDAGSEKLVQSALDAIMVGRTSIVVAHRLSTIRNAHMIAVVNQGVVVETGTHEELLAKGPTEGQYAGLVAHQQQAGA